MSWEDTHPCTAPHRWWGKPR